MTKLEEEMKQAMIEGQWGLGAPQEIIIDVMAQAAAEVAKKYIEEAFIDGYYALANIDSEEWPHPEEITGKILADKWLKENGII